jgi:hypothetical protein
MTEEERSSRTIIEEILCDGEDNKKSIRTSSTKKRVPRGYVPIEQVINRVCDWLENSSEAFPIRFNCKNTNKLAADILGIGKNTVYKYRSGDPNKYKPKHPYIKKECPHPKRKLKPEVVALVREIFDGMKEKLGRDPPTQRVYNVFKERYPDKAIFGVSALRAYMVDEGWVKAAYFKRKKAASKSKQLKQKNSS